MVELLDLPSNNLIEILAKLPITTIHACRCTCKTFLELTINSNSYFVNLYSSNNPSTQNLIVRFSSIAAKRLRKYVHFIDTQLDLTEPGSSSTIRTVPKLRARPMFKIPKHDLVNACNGLMYLATIEAAPFCSIVYNPITRENVCIPEVDVEKLGQVTLNSCLGYSPRSGKYKVLRTYMDYSGLHSQIHDVGSTSWRDVETSPSDHISSKNSYAFVNGVGYWLCCNNRDYIQRLNNFILYFKFDDEVFGRISVVPPSVGMGRLQDCSLMSIGVDGDGLCLIDNTWHLDVWSLDIKNLDEMHVDWIEKYICLLDEDDKPPYLCDTRVTPLQVTSNGDMLMVANKRDLVFYDRKSDKFRMVNSHMKKISNNFDDVHVTFTPSFVPLKDALAGTGQM